MLPGLRDLRRAGQHRVGDQLERPAPRRRLLFAPGLARRLGERREQALAHGVVVRGHDPVREVDGAEPLEVGAQEIGLLEVPDDERQRADQLPALLVEADAVEERESLGVALEEDVVERL